MRQKLLFSLFALVAATSCDEQVLPVVFTPEYATLPNEYVDLNINCNLPFEAEITRAAAVGNDGKVSNAQIFVFDKYGLVEGRALSSTEITNKSVSGIKVKKNVGNCTVCVVANKALNLTNMTSVATIESQTFSLSEDAVTTTGPIMYGKAIVPVAATDASVTVPLERRVGRVVLSSVTNNLPASYGTMTLKCAYLYNVVAKQNMSGNFAYTSANFCNADAGKGGAHATKAAIQTSSDSAIPTLLFNSLSSASVARGASYSTNCYFYGYANSSATPAGWRDTFTPAATGLMVVCTIGGTDYYYPIPIKSGDGTRMIKNYNTKVDLTIIGLGNTIDNWVEPISKVALTNTISITAWGDASVAETI